jgi:hypothetical protein
MDYSQLKHLEFRRKFWKFVGAEIFIDDPATNTEVGYIKMKGWKLREDVRIYRDRTMQHQIAEIHARQIIDFGATYDVTDSATGQPAFALRRKGLKSAFVRDHWDIYDTDGAVMGSIQETSGALALARRWLEIIPYVNIVSGIVFAFIVQTYEIRLQQSDGSKPLIGTIVHRKNPVVVKMSLDTSVAEAAAAPLLPLAATTMLCIMDAAKND